MKKRLFIFTTLIILAGLCAFFGFSVYVSRANNINAAKDAVVETVQILSGLYSESADAMAFAQVGRATRITLISAEGAVLADSLPLDLATLENHLNRPEIQAAAGGAPEAFVRFSDSLGVDFLYYAMKVDSGDSYIFVRAAIPVASANEYIRQSLPLLVGLLLAIAVFCFILSHGMIKRITRPLLSVESRLRLLSSGAYTQEPMAASDEEIDAIVGGIDEVAQVLQSSFAELRDEKTKLDYVLGNIGDGLFVVDESKCIALINAAAMGLFGVNQEIFGKDLFYLSHDKSLVETLRRCVDHQEDALFELVIAGRILLTTVKQLPHSKLTMVIMTDVTENRESAKRREEFFANASHELKTPLTAIKGFNELMALHNKDEGIRKYIDSITRETERMLALIGDMLKLSELENALGINPRPVSLAQIANEAREALSGIIAEKGIVLESSGDATVMAEPEHVYELVKNILENAVRYSNQGGRVSLAIGSDKKTKWIVVSDEGIGISPQEQSRIFERFYRVEKSRSHRGGGTGLGLSIVKHICALYGWSVTLKSKLGVGTEVSIVCKADDIG